MIAHVQALGHDASQILRPQPAQTTGSGNATTRSDAGKRRTTPKKSLVAGGPAKKSQSAASVVTHYGAISMKIEYTSVRELRPQPNNARTHSKKQIRQIAKQRKTQ